MALPAKRFELETAMKEREPARGPQGPGDPPPPDGNKNVSWIRDAIAELRTDVRELRTKFGALPNSAFAICGFMLVMFGAGYALLSQRAESIQQDLRQAISAHSKGLDEKLSKQSKALQAALSNDFHARLSEQSTGFQKKLSEQSDRIYDKLLDLHAIVARLDARTSTSSKAMQDRPIPTAPPQATPLETR
jgi:DNA anti-recombination protein RmuC